MKLIYFYRFIYNEEYAYLCVGNNNTPPSPTGQLSKHNFFDLGQDIFSKNKIGNANLANS